MNITFPLAETFGNHLACYNDDPMMMAPDNKTAPQVSKTKQNNHLQDEVHLF